MTSPRAAVVLVFGLALSGCVDEAGGPVPATPAPKAQASNSVGSIEQELAESVARGEKQDNEYVPYPADSPQQQALAALEQAEALALHSLLSWDDHDVVTQMFAALPSDGGDDGEQRRLHDAWCQRGSCIGGERDLGSTPITSPADKSFVQTLLGGWMAKEPNYAAACIAQYHHAVSFHGDGHRYDVLLCYGCGQYKLLRDGVAVAEGQAAYPVGLAGMNARLAAAGLSYYDADREVWIGPPLPADALEFESVK